LTRCRCARFRLRAFDTAQRLWPQPADDILIETVAIDDESLRRWGQWPWPHMLVADLVRRIGRQASGPRDRYPVRRTRPVVAAADREHRARPAEIGGRSAPQMPSSEKQLAG
jgi:hypothetical protein